MERSGKERRRGCWGSMDCCRWWEGFGRGGGAGSEGMEDPEGRSEGDGVAGGGRREGLR